VSGVTPVSYAEYDENAVIFNWETEKTGSFNISFSGEPIVVLDIIPNADLENINFYLDFVTTPSTQFKIQTSAPFSGSIVYRAIYSPTYPVFVRRDIISSSYFYTASAGYIDISGSSAFTSSYSSLGDFPTKIFFTPYDTNANNDANVFLVGSGSYGLTSTSGDISANITNRINFLVIK
jgi:hypothetical protein